MKTLLALLAAVCCFLSFSSMQFVSSATSCVPEMSSVDDIITLSDGVQLPAQRLTSNTCNASSKHVILCHGLGAKNPKHKDHSSDHWLPIVSSAVAPLVQSTVLFTSRGHRGTSGWEATAESDLNQFTWKRLAGDMMQVAGRSTAGKVIVGGSSMGSAAALYAALQYPDKVAGVIMVRPPTGWEERLSRRHVLMASAARCQTDNQPEDKHHFVLQGTALSDFPALDDMDAYARVTCPVLLLAVEGDATHPLSSARNLADRLAKHQLVISKDMEEAKAVWPEIIARFVSELEVS